MFHCCLFNKTAIDQGFFGKLCQSKCFQQLKSSIRSSFWRTITKTVLSFEPQTICFVIFRNTTRRLEL